MKIFLAPHDDDESLFGAFTIMREKPLVVFCTDSFIQPERGEKGCSAEERAAESAAACKHLGVQHIRLGIPDNEVTLERLVIELKRKCRDDLFSSSIDVVYAPLVQHGNPHHDLVSMAADHLWPWKTIYYPTYTKTELYTTGTQRIFPSVNEYVQKERACDAHQSQVRINGPHFAAVFKGRDEWLVGNKKLHLGCGKDIRRGWVNLDQTPESDVVHDARQPLPFADNSFDIVYSQDFMEHLPPESKVPIINEIWRVLKPGGFMEHVIPNAGSMNDFGSPSHLSHWSRQQFEHFDVDSYRYEKDRGYEGFIGGFRKVFSELLSPRQEEDGVVRYQAIHIKYQAVK